MRVDLVGRAKNRDEVCDGACFQTYLLMFSSNMIPASYRHAVDSGVYLRGVDSSVVGGRMPVDPRMVGDAAVLLLIGQSNGGNHGDVQHVANRRVFNFNVFDGLCYPARDPLLGATGDGGSPWCILGDALVEAGFASSVLLVPLCVGGATVEQWAPGGGYHHRMTYCLRRLSEAGFWPSHVLWHQGEANALYGTEAAAYCRAFRALVGSLRQLEISAPVYVAIASYFAVPGGYAAQQQVVGGAQRSLVDAEEGIFQGPDTDVIRERYDGCHIGGDGLIAHAQAWRVVLTGSVSGTHSVRS